MQSADLSSSYFALFDLPVSFDIDLKALAERYRTLQQTVHPDRFVNAAEPERRLSVQMAARINEGFQTLKDPLARGRYLLEIRGVELDDLDTAFDSAFLMEQMEFRERLEAVKECDNPHQQLTKISSDINARIKEMTKELAAQFIENSESSLNEARDLTRKMQFFRKLENEAELLDEDMGGY